jgi:hypothetical protein
MNDGFDLNIEAHTILRDALRARGEQRMNALMGETAQCLHTDRVRELAAMAAGVTVQEQQHVTGCVRCRSRVRAFQRAKLATPERLLEAALQQTRAASLSMVWSTFAESRAQELHEAFVRESAWRLTYAIGDTLRIARIEGASDSECAHVLATLLDAVAAVARDVLGLWSSDFDSAWPILELLRETSREAALAGDATREQFIASYARIAAVAPTYLKALLAERVDEIGERDLLERELALSHTAEETQALLEQMRAIRDEQVRGGVTALTAFASGERSSVYIAIEASRALSEDDGEHARILSRLLAGGRAELRHGVIVALRHTCDAVGIRAQYERRGEAWIFTASARHPLAGAAIEAARLAQQHPDLIESFQWFNHRFEPETKNEPIPHRR